MPLRRDTNGGRVWAQRQPKGPISELPVLPDGQNIERNGLRCSAYNGGVACGNVSGGVAFFVCTRYQLISDSGKRPVAPKQRPAAGTAVEGAKNPVI